MQINNINFWKQSNYLWKVPISHTIQKHWKKTSSIKGSSVLNLTLENNQLNNSCLWNCLWTTNTYQLIAQKVFLFQMLRETSIFTLSEKVSLWKKMSKWCFVWQNENRCLHWHIVTQWLLGNILLGIIVAKEWNSMVIMGSQFFYNKYYCTTQ